MTTLPGDSTLAKEWEGCHCRPQLTLARCLTALRLPREAKAFIMQFYGWTPSTTYEERQLDNSVSSYYFYRNPRRAVADDMMVVRNRASPAYFHRNFNYYVKLGYVGRSYSAQCFTWKGKRTHLYWHKELWQMIKLRQPDRRWMLVQHAEAPF